MSSRQHCVICGMSTWAASGVCGRCKRHPPCRFTEWEREPDEFDRWAQEGCDSDATASAAKTQSQAPPEPKASKETIDRIGVMEAANAVGVNAVRNTLLGSDGGEQ